jgi:hypothetical protein
MQQVIAVSQAIANAERAPEERKHRPHYGLHTRRNTTNAPPAKPRGTPLLGVFLSLENGYTSYAIAYFVFIC